MLPNKQYVTKEQLENEEREISWIEKAISRYQTIAAGGKEGRLEAISLMKDVREVHRREKDILLANPGYTAARKDLVPSDVSWQLLVTKASALEEAYTHMIGMLENPKSAMEAYETELKARKKHLAELKKYSVR